MDPKIAKVILITASSIGVAWIGYFSVLGNLASDRFLRMLFERHRDIWNKAGQPEGWLWRGRVPDEEKWACQTIHIQFFSETSPDWLPDDEQLAMQYQRTRKLVRSFYLSLVIGFPMVAGCLVAYGLIH